MEAQIKEIAWIIVNDRVACINLGITAVLSLVISVTVSSVCGFLVPCFYAGGVVAFYVLFRTKAIIGNTLNTTSNSLKPVKSKLKLPGCSVCGDDSCDRDKGPLKHPPPWDDVFVHHELDASIESLLKRILNEFVSSWYSSVSSDLAFELELRNCIRYASSVVLKRSLKIDLGQIIFKKLVPAGISHLDDYLVVRDMSENKRIPFVRAAVQHLGTRVHPATLNRDQELEYLRQITECLLPVLLTCSQIHCQNFRVLVRELLAGWVLLPLADVLADPSILNSLLLLLLGRQQLTDYKDTGESKVQFLKKFVTSGPRQHSALHPDVSNILKDQKLLYAFMQFLKGENAVNVLQFCLDVEEFNRKMLTPDMSPEDTDLLYRDAMDLYSVYFNPQSPDSISLPPEIVSSMKQVLAEDVGKLRTSPPLFQAYEHAYNLLENELCPLFHASDEFFKWMSGPRLSSGTSRSGTRQNRKSNDNVGAVARISNRLHKIKGVLRGPVEGHTFDSDPAIDFASESEFAEEMQILDESDRDLSAWRVSIPSVQTRFDASNKPYSVFIIDVQRIDVTREVDSEGNHWSVERRYNDFYALEGKLTEFHGEFQDTQLPTRRMLFFSAPGRQFLESRKQVFEDYVQKLLSKPALRGSDLLYAFLRLPGEFADMNASPDGLSRLIRRTVPLTLRKEKGQHLEPFINAFYLSTEGKKSSKIEYKDISQESPPARQFRNINGPIFRNNFNLTNENAPQQTKSNTTLTRPANLRSLRLEGLSNCLIHIGVSVYKISRPWLRIALAVRALLGHTLDAIVCFLARRALNKLLIAPRLAHLTHLLEGAIFNSKSTFWNSMEIEEKACRELDQFCSSCWSAKLAAPALKGAFCALQCPQLNKQLFYTLLDMVIEELFPELRLREESVDSKNYSENTVVLASTVN